MKSALQRRAARLGLIGLVAGAGLALTSGTAFAGSSGSAGAVHIQTNSAPVNFVRQFCRAGDGTLTEGALYPTGGSGITVTPPLGAPILDSQGAVVRTENGRLVFAVNGGSNTVSSFRVGGARGGGDDDDDDDDDDLRIASRSGDDDDGDGGGRCGLALVDQESSRGSLPVSAAVTNLGRGRALLYVLNAGTQGPPLGGTAPASVSGYIVDRNGAMTPIPGAVYPVSDPVAAQVGFDAKGRVLTVTARGTNRILTRTVAPSTGLLGPEQSAPATGTGLPFGFEFSKRNHLVVANVGNLFVNSTASSYGVSSAGAVSPIDVESTAGGAACWVAITPDGKFAYLTNSLTFTIARFRLQKSGHLDFLGLTPDTTGGAPFDEDTSANGRYLYVLSSEFNPVTFTFGLSHVNAYRIGRDGGLTLIDQTTPMPFNGASGLAAF